MRPREGERCFLRLLLLHVTGAKSFVDMRNVDGEVCSSFRQSCSRRGLLADDAECRRVLRESFASEFVPLSQVFATIRAYCEPSDPLSLWDEHKSLFVSDIRLRHRGRATVHCAFICSSRGLRVIEADGKLQFRNIPAPDSAR